MTSLEIGVYQVIQALIMLGTFSVGYGRLKQKVDDLHEKLNTEEETTRIGGIRQDSRMDKMAHIPPCPEMLNMKADIAKDFGTVNAQLATLLERTEWMKNKMGAE